MNWGSLKDVILEFIIVDRGAATASSLERLYRVPVVFLSLSVVDMIGSWLVVRCPSFQRYSTNYSTAHRVHG